MKKNLFIGVDVSKLTLDICFFSERDGSIDKIKVANDAYAVRTALTSFLRDNGFALEDALVCAEHTGQYTYPLICACQTTGFFLWIENAAQIKACSGLVRGKNDAVDAERIAMYSMRFQDKAVAFTMPAEELVRLKQLAAERRLYVSDLSKYRGQLKDQEGFMDQKIYKAKCRRFKKMIAGLEKCLDEINDAIDTLIRASDTLSRQYDRLTSVEGVGPVLAVETIITTEAFTRFDNPRKFSCYVGVAPFAYTSGTSVRSGSHVSHRANKHMKKLLHMGAVSILNKKNGDLKEYYDRKIAEGKNKMSVINALRGKMIARMFASVRNDRPYAPVTGRRGTILKAKTPKHEKRGRESA